MRLLINGADPAWMRSEIDEEGPGQVVPLMSAGDSMQQKDREDKEEPGEMLSMAGGDGPEQARP